MTRRRAVLRHQLEWTDQGFPFRQREGREEDLPTRFEVGKTDHEPSEDLNILIVQWTKPE